MKKRKTNRSAIFRIAILLLCTVSLFELVTRKVTPQENFRIQNPKTLLNVSLRDIENEIQGPNQVDCGNLIVFETSQAADWCLAPSGGNVGKWAVDSSGRFLYFASTQPGEYTVCAAIVVEGKAKILTKTFRNQSECAPDPDSEPEPTPQPTPQPQPEPEPQPQNDLALWIAANTQELSRCEKYEQEKEQFASCFQKVVSGIEHGSIRSGASARAQLKICISSQMLSCSDASGNLWRQFCEKLSAEIEKRSANNSENEPENVQNVKSLFGEIAQCLRREAGGWRLEENN